LKKIRRPGGHLYHLPTASNKDFFGAYPVWYAKKRTSKSMDMRVLSAAAAPAALHALQRINKSRPSWLYHHAAMPDFVS
jgi:hypothetical protein